MGYGGATAVKGGGLKDRQGYQFCMAVDGSWRPDQRDVKVLDENKVEHDTLVGHSAFPLNPPIKGHNGLGCWAKHPEVSSWLKAPVNTQS